MAAALQNIGAQRLANDATRNGGAQLAAACIFQQNITSISRRAAAAQRRRDHQYFMRRHNRAHLAALFAGRRNYQRGAICGLRALPTYLFM